MYFLLTVPLKIIASKLKSTFLSRGNKRPENKKMLKIILFNFDNNMQKFNFMAILFYDFSFLENYSHFHLCPRETYYGKDSKKSLHG